MEQIIVQSAEPIRLDRYLRRHYEGANQGMIEKLLRVGKIKLNNVLYLLKYIMIRLLKIGLMRQIRN